MNPHPFDRSSELDALLDLARRVHVPEGLAHRVLEGLRSREERALDVLLEVARSDGEADAAPSGLAERVTARALAEARSLERAPRALTRRVAALAAAAVLATTAAWWGSRAGGRAEPAPGAPDPELLSALPLLERWELLSGDDAPPELDLLDLESLARLGAEDELLLLLLAEENG